MNFPEKMKSKTHYIGPILNKNIINFSPSNKIFNKDFFSILVLGGSQGAEIFGKIIPPVIKMLEENGCKIFINQQCSKNQKDNIVDFYERNGIKNNVFEFDDDVLKLIASSNLAISRCGASATEELIYTQTPFIGVPLPNSIDNHQYLNGKYYENKGCCFLLEQRNFNSLNLFNLIIENIKNESKLQKMCEKMKKNITSDVYDNLEKIIRELI